MKHFALIQKDEPLPSWVDARNLFASTGKGRGAEQAPAYSTALQGQGEGQWGSRSDPRGTRICS